MPKKQITALLIISDVFFAFLAFFAAYGARNFGPIRLYLNSVQPLKIYLQTLPVAILLLLIILNALRLYEPRQRLSGFNEFYLVMRGVLFWMLVIMSTSYLYKYDYSRIIVVTFGILTIFFVGFGRYLVGQLQRKRAKQNKGLTKIIIVGAGKPGRFIKKELENYYDLGIRVVGFIDDNISEKEGINIIGSLKELESKIKELDINEVFIAKPDLSYEYILEIVSTSKNSHVRFKIAANVFRLATGDVKIDEIEAIPALDLKKSKPGMIFRIAKRIMDLSIGFIFLLISLPFWVFVILLIKLESSGKVILKQDRVGLDGKIFKMYKFRTMQTDTKIFAPAPRDKDDERITKIGKFLRKTSLDELPQLLNVLKGEMSMVGPRPEMPFIVETYQGWQKKRLEAKPGITGLWQILGRKNLPLAENLEYDFYYLNNQSIILDLVILLKTIPVVLFGKGAY